MILSWGAGHRNQKAPAQDRSDQLEPPQKPTGYFHTWWGVERALTRLQRCREILTQRMPQPLGVAGTFGRSTSCAPASPPLISASLIEVSGLDAGAQL